MDVRLLGIVASLAAFILGLAIYLKGRRNPINISFALFSLIGAVWSLGLYFYANPLFFPSLIWIKIVYLLCFPLISSAFYFSFVFPERKTKQANKFQLLYYLIAAIFLYFLLFTNLWVKDVVGTKEGFKTLLGPVYPFWGLFNLLIGFWIFANFFKKYQKSKGLIRAQLKYVFLGIGVMAAGTLILDVLIPVLTGSSRYFWASSLFLIPFIVSTGYAIVRHRLMDIHLVVARSVSYTLLLFILGALYAGGILGGGLFLYPYEIGRSQFILSIFWALIIALSFQPLRRFLEKVTDKIFYKERYDSHALLGELSYIMASVLALEELVDLVLGKLLSQMKVSFGFLLLTRNQSIVWVRGLGRKKPPEFDEKEIHSLIKRALKNKQENLLVFEELPEGRAKKLMREQGLSLVLPLLVEEKAIGTLLLGEKSSGDIYTSEDVNVLKILAPEMAVAVKNAQSYEEIKRFSITLEEEVKRATSRLKKANERLKELDKLKDEFVSVASHELRTPMTAIKGYLWLLLKHQQKLPPKDREHLQRTYESTERMITLVRDMLDVSRIEGGRIELHPEKLDLAQLAQEVKEELAAKAEEKKIKMKVEADKAYWVRADKDKTHQVLTNVIGNALKFTPDGGVVTVSFQEKGKVVETSVTDTGIGIKKEDLPKLFIKFGRLDTSLSAISEASGTGLGLYICKKIVELSGGKIWVESEVNKGSTFIFSLPAA